MIAYTPKINNRLARVGKLNGPIIKSKSNGQNIQIRNENSIANRNTIKAAIMYLIHLIGFLKPMMMNIIIGDNNKVTELKYKCNTSSSVNGVGSWSGIYLT